MTHSLQLEPQTAVKRLEEVPVAMATLVDVKAERAQAELAVTTGLVSPSMYIVTFWATILVSVRFKKLVAKEELIVT